MRVLWVSSGVFCCAALFLFAPIWLDEPPPSGHSMEHVIVLGCELSLMEGRVRRSVVEVGRLRGNCSKVVNVVFTGGGGEAAMMAAAFERSGGGNVSMILEQQSRTTHENAQMVAVLLGNKSDAAISIVTDPWHIPRAMTLFRKFFPTTPLRPVWTLLPDELLARHLIWSAREVVATLKGFVLGHYSLASYVSEWRILWDRG